MLEGTRNIVSTGLGIFTLFGTSVLAMDRYPEIRDAIKEASHPEVIDDAGFAELFANGATVIGSVLSVVLLTYLAGRGSYRLMGGRSD